ncbi:MAG: hypothetical protein GXX11_04840 [Acholeplasmataceae bacterium]|nr:hypothetical protein [Acholeplasmataceae bacterium]
MKFSCGEVVDVFVNENEELIKTGAAFATLSQSAVTAEPKCSFHCVECSIKAVK